MPAIRSGFSRSRSISADPVPAASARCRSAGLASRTAVSALANASAIACSAASLAPRVDRARTSDAARARPALFRHCHAPKSRAPLQITSNHSTRPVLEILSRNEKMAPGLKQAVLGFGNRRHRLTRLVLPEHLAVLMSGRQYIDVVGPAKPWPVPPGWWDRARTQVRALIDDPRATASQKWTGWPEQTRDVAPFLQNLAMSLGGYVAIFAGEFAQFPEQLRRRVPRARPAPRADGGPQLVHDRLRVAAVPVQVRQPRSGLSARGPGAVVRLRPVPARDRAAGRTRAEALLGIYDRVLQSARPARVPRGGSVSRRWPGCGDSPC